MANIELVKKVKRWYIGSKLDAKGIIDQSFLTPAEVADKGTPKRISSVDSWLKYVPTNGSTETEYKRIDGDNSAWKFTPGIKPVEESWGFTEHFIQQHEYLFLSYSNLSQVYSYTSKDKIKLFVDNEARKLDKISLEDKLNFASGQWDRIYSIYEPTTCIKIIPLMEDKRVKQFITEIKEIWDRNKK